MGSGGERAGGGIENLHPSGGPLLVFWAAWCLLLFIHTAVVTLHM